MLTSQLIRFGSRLLWPSNQISSIAPALRLAATTTTTAVTQRRSYSSDKRTPSDGEKKLINLLRARFPSAKTIEVNDISGGCGSMYEIYVETKDFNDIRTVKQHQLINETLKTEITQNMHGVRIFTSGVKD